MPVQLPYLSSYKNVPKLFDKIASAKIPDNFNRIFMQDTIGLKSKSDRPLIPFLRTLGFIDTTNKPTPKYSLLKGSVAHRKTAIAEGMRKAYGPLFDADEDVYSHQGDKLRSLVSQVAGTDEDMTGRIANTFAAVAKLGDFKANVPTEDTKKGDKDQDKGSPDGEGEHDIANVGRKLKGLRTEFHYNIQVVLPSNATEEVYLNIFNAIRKTFQ
jgi:hypothetical protein